MIRISIKWDFISPILQAVGGIAEVHYVRDTTKWALLTRFKVTCESGSLGYKSIDDKGVPTVILDAIKPQLDTMIRSFQAGVMLNIDTYTWITKEDQIKSMESFKAIPYNYKETDKIFICEDSDEDLKGKVKK